MSESNWKLRGIHVVKNIDLNASMKQMAHGIGRVAAVSNEGFGEEKLWAGKAR
jgi:hypothetical protein